MRRTTSGLLWRGYMQTGDMANREERDRQGEFHKKGGGASRRIGEELPGKVVRSFTLRQRTVMLVFDDGTTLEVSGGESRLMVKMYAEGSVVEG